MEQHPLEQKREQTELGGSGFDQKGGVSVAPPPFQLTSDSGQGGAGDAPNDDDSFLQGLKNRGKARISEDDKRRAKGIIAEKASSLWQRQLPQFENLKLNGEEKRIQDTVTKAIGAIEKSDANGKTVRLAYLRKLRNLPEQEMALLTRFLLYKGQQTKGQIGVDRFVAFIVKIGDPGLEIPKASLNNFRTETEYLGSAESYGKFINRGTYRAYYDLAGSALNAKSPRDPQEVRQKGMRLRVSKGADARGKSIAKSFLRKIMEGAVDDGKVVSKSASYVSNADLLALAQLQKSPHKRAILDRIRSNVKSRLQSGNPLELAEMIAHAEVAARLEQVEGADFEKAEASDEAPKIQTPVEGRILPDTRIGPGMTVDFQFLEKDKVDDFRVPRISIQWRLMDEQPDADDPYAAPKLLKKNTSSYIPLRGHNVLANDRTFQFKFEKEGTYKVLALVHHNFYKGHQLVELPVRVEKEGSRLDKMSADAGIKGMEKHDEQFGSLAPISGHSQKQKQGFRFTGEFDDQTLADIRQNSSLEHINQQIIDLTRLVRKYKGEKGKDNSAYIEWGEKRIEELKEYNKTINAAKYGKNSHQIGCTGFFASRQQGVPDQPLKLSGYLSEEKKGDQTWLRFQLFDITEAEGSGQFTFDHSLPVEDKPIAKAQLYQQLVKQAFTDLTDAYPQGSVRFYAQQFDGNKPNKQLIGFERVTDNIPKDVTAVAYHPYVKMGVNMATAMASVFPPTAPLGVTVGLLYNGLEAGYNLSQDANRGTAGTKNVVEIGSLALDLVPLLGKATQAGKGYKAIQLLKATANGLNKAGSCYLLAEGVYTQLRNIQNGDLKQLMALEKDYATLAQNGAGPELLQPQERAIEEVKKRIRFNTASVLTEAALTHGLTMASQAFVSRFASGRASMYMDQQYRMSLADPQKQTMLPTDLQKDVPVITDPSMGEGNTVRVHFETGPGGLVTSVTVRAGSGATQTDIDAHVGTIRLLKRYQGISGMLTRLKAKMRLHNSHQGDAFDPRTRKFEAEAEITKLSAMIDKRRKQLGDSSKTGSMDKSVVGEMETEIQLLEMQMKKHKAAAEGMDGRLGKGFIAAESTKGLGKHGAEAIKAGYPAPPANHYYRKNKDGSFRLVYTGSTLNKKIVVTRDDGSMALMDDPNNKRLRSLKKGETRTYDNGAVEKKMQDGAIWILSKLGTNKEARKQFERKVLPPGVKMDSKKWERAHSQGPGTGFESAQGLLYAPRELNQEFQNKGIEKLFRVIPDWVKDDVTLMLGTETRAHKGTFLLKSITYVLFGVGPDGRKNRLMEVELTVPFEKQPKIGLSAPFISSECHQYFKSLDELKLDTAD